MSKLKEGFFKVKQDGSTFIYATFFNPTTGEEFSECVRDYDYSDGSRDNDELYYMPIDEDVRRQWMHHHGVILEGDIIQVVKGRKVPVGTVATVRKKYPFNDKYGRFCTMYLYLDNGMKTNIDNCIMVKAK